MSDKTQKDISKWKVAIIGIGFVIGVAMLIFGGSDGVKEEIPKDSIDVYMTSVEERLEDLCEAVTGGEVRAFVSCEGGFSYSYALDSRGGVITIGSGSAKEAVVESVSMPKISGVGIVCRGGRYDESEILELVSSALGIGKNKIFITCAKKSEG